MSDYENKTELVKTKKQNTANHKTGDKVIKFSKLKKKRKKYMVQKKDKEKSRYPLIKNEPHLAHLSQNH